MSYINAQFPQQQQHQSNEHISDLPKQTGNSNITTIRILSETQDVRAIGESSYLCKLKKKTSQIPKLTWSILKIFLGYSIILTRFLSPTKRCGGL